jgi:hypothetical protein
MNATTDLLQRVSYSPLPQHPTFTKGGEFEPSFTSSTDRNSPPLPNWPKPVSASVLCQNPPPTPPELVEGILYQGGTMLAAGPSKAHKTYTMLDLGIGVASGTEWLGFKCHQKPVLYLNLELPEFAAAKRVKDISVAKGLKNPPLELHLWNLRDYPVTLDLLKLRLPEKIKKLGIGLVVVDPHYKVSHADENNNTEQGKFLSCMQTICGCNDAALCITHHFAKGDAASKKAIDRASGAGVFARWGDVMMTFTDHEVEDAMTVDLSLRLFALIKPFVLRWEHPIWRRDLTLDPAKLKKPGRPSAHTDDDVLKALGAGPMTHGEWQRASGIPETSFDRHRKRLVRNRKVTRSGQYYQLAES